MSTLLNIAWALARSESLVSLRHVQWQLRQEGSVFNIENVSVLQKSVPSSSLKGLATKWKVLGWGVKNQISTFLTEEVSLEGSGLFGRAACWNDCCTVPAKWVTTNATRLMFDTIAKFIFFLFKKVGGEKNGERKIHVHKHPTVFWLGHVSFFQDPQTFPSLGMLRSYTDRKWWG